MKKLLKKSINKLGYRITRTSNTSEAYLDMHTFLLSNFYQTLKKLDFNPKHVVDVGANHGSWTREALEHFPDAHFTLVDPQHWLKKSFQDILDSNPKVRFHAVGAGEKEGSFQFTIHDRDDSSSFRYSEEDAKNEGLKQIEIPVVTLNKLLSDPALPIPDMIKIDAEGLDIEVLNGSSDFFGKTEIFLIEAGVGAKVFDNSFLNVINYMDQKGYRLFDITGMNRPFIPEFLWLVELAFIKKEGFIDLKVKI
jgi:FkbM family methyltransferase